MKAELRICVCVLNTVNTSRRGGAGIVRNIKGGKLLYNVDDDSVVSLPKRGKADNPEKRSHASVIAANS